MLSYRQGPVEPGSALWSSRIGREGEVEGDREDRSFCRSSTHVIIQSLNPSWLFATPWTAAHQSSLSVTISLSLLKLTSIELVMPSSHLIRCRPLLLLPSIFPCIRVLSNESALHIGWPKYCSSASVLPMNHGIPVNPMVAEIKKVKWVGGRWLGNDVLRKISFEIPK